MMKVYFMDLETHSFIHLKKMFFFVAGFKCGLGG